MASQVQPRQPLSAPLSERIVIGLAILLALLVLTLSQMSGAVRFYLFGTGMEDLTSRTVGVVLDLQGTCERKAKNSMEFNRLQKGDPVYAQDTIVTGGQSGCSISVVGDRTIVMAESSLVTLSFQLGLSGFFLNLPELFESKSASVQVQASNQAAIDALKALRVTVPKAPPVPIAKATPKAQKYVLPAVQAAPIPEAAPKEVRIQEPRMGTKIAPTLSQAIRNEIDLPFVAEVKSKDPKVRVTDGAGFTAEWQELGNPQVNRLQLEDRAGVLKSRITVKKPGMYSVRILNATGEVVKTQSFEVTPRVRGIDLKPVPSSVKPKLTWSSKIPPPYTLVLSHPKEGVKRIPANKAEVQLGEISAEYEYTAQVLANTPDGFQYESETRKFGMAYTPPDIRTPAEGEKISAPRGKKITITWNKTIGAVSYTLDVAADAAFTKAIAAIESPVNFTKLRFLNTGDYFARIHVKTRFGKTFIGPVRKFHVTIRQQAADEDVVY